MTQVLEQPTAESIDVEVPQLVGLMAEFRDVDSVMNAARHIRDQGFQRWDVHTPFPVHGMDAAMGIKTTILPWLVLGAGLTGGATGFGLAVFCNYLDYAFLISGKPFISLPAWIPIMFELTVLFAALTAVFGMIGLNNLPRLYNPLFKSRAFKRVTNDRFFVVIEASDPKFDEHKTQMMLNALDAASIERVED